MYIHRIYPESAIQGRTGLWFGSLNGRVYPAAEFLWLVALEALRAVAEGRPVAGIPLID